MPLRINGFALLSVLIPLGIAGWIFKPAKSRRPQPPHSGAGLASFSLAGRNPAVPALLPTRAADHSERGGNRRSDSEGLDRFGTEIIQLIRDHPQWGFSEYEARELQGRYRHLQLQRNRLEAELATVTPVSPTENLVEIPAYREQEEELFEHFAAGITYGYALADIPALIGQLQSRFLGTSSAPANHPQQLLVTAMTGEAYDYKIVRQSECTDSAGQSGEAVEVDRVSAGELGNYENQAEFFPVKP